MKLGLLGDIHARSRAPAGRKDDWFNVQLSKFNEALDYFKDNGCMFVLQPGDFFDSPKPVNQVLSAYIMALREHGMILLAVLGQHDTYYHDVVNKERTALHVLQSAGVAKILESKPFAYENVQIYGSSWEQKPPAMRRRSEGVTKILVAHSHIGNHPLWPGHILPSPHKYASNNPGFDLILLGDYHYRFVERFGKRDYTNVVNMGCLMRMRNTPMDREHKPAVGIYDTADRQVEPIHMLSIEDADVVFKKATETEAEVAPMLEEFLARLSSTGKLGTSFWDNLQAIIKAREADMATRNEVSGILEAVGVKDE